MAIKQFFALSILIVLLTGCADEYYQPQYPAPIYGGGQTNAGSYPNYPPEQPAVSPPPQKKTHHKRHTAATRPLRDSNPPRVVKIPSTPVVPESEMPQSVPEQKVEILPPFPDQPASVPEVASESEKSDVFMPMESNAPLSAPVGALVLAAKEDTESGNLESAGTSIERAIRIEPRNATLFYKLAVVRLNQSQPRLAEDLAKKSALLAAGDTKLKKHSWLLIAKARELLNNPDGVKAAKKKAEGFN